MVLQLPRHRFTSAEYQKMGEAGIFTEDDRVELLDGEIVEMSAIGNRHVACVDRLTALLFRVARGRAIALQAIQQVLQRVQSDPVCCYGTTRGGLVVRNGTAPFG